MQVTQKKTLRLKKPESPAAEPAAGSSVAPSAAPAPVVVAAPSDSGAGASAIIALFATLFFAALLVMQWIEMSYYRDAIPRPLLQTVPSAAPAPDAGV